MAQVRSRRGEYTEATRTALLDSATRLFAEQGYRRTSLDEIAADARVTKGAIYHHFTSKDGLFEAVFDRLEAAETARMREAFESAPDPATGALDGVDRFLLSCSDPVYGSLVFREGPIALGWERWRECEQKYAYALVADILTALVDGGVIALPYRDTFVTLMFGMLGAAGQLLAAARPEQLPRLRRECRLPFVAMLAGMQAIDVAEQLGAS